MTVPPRILSRALIYDGWLRLESVRFRMPDGEVVERHVEDHGAAASVLPYDPTRKTVLLVSMPRAPVSDSGVPDLLEAIAGRIEDEDAETCVRREALEEGGVRLGELELVVQAWSLPSISTERNSLFLAPFGEDDLIGEGEERPTRMKVSPFIIFLSPTHGRCWKPAEFQT